MKPPPGYRLLYQDFKSRTEEEARAAVARIFGPGKAQAALFVSGTHGPPRGAKTWQWGKYWVMRPCGYRAYLRVEYKEERP